MWHPTQVQSCQSFVTSGALQRFDQSGHIKIWTIQQTHGLQMWQQLNKIAMSKSWRINTQCMQIVHFGQKTLREGLHVWRYWTCTMDQHVLNLVCKLTHCQQRFIGEAPVVVQGDMNPDEFVVHEATEMLMHTCQIEYGTWIQVLTNGNDEFSGKCEQLQR